jgi:sugar-specific transcriptional regulator TrmB
MTTEHLEALGLSDQQATLYAILIKSGPIKARDLVPRTPYNRGVVYKILDELENLGIVTRDDKPNQVSLFQAAHPSALKTLLQQKEQEIRSQERILNGILPSLLSSYNLSIGRPGVTFYEGEQGFIDILNDSLTSSEEIFTYVDSETLSEHSILHKEKKYVESRIKKRIPKRILVTDTPFARKNALIKQNEFTEFRFLPKSVTLFAAAMEIYDGKVSYLTYHEDIITGLLIEHPAIYTMHRQLFAAQWKMFSE